GRRREHDGGAGQRSSTIHREGAMRQETSFFFSSRRRHTSCLSDWSSDVCSSDLVSNARTTVVPTAITRPPRRRAEFTARAVGYKIGRASCRERGWIAGGGASLRRKSRLF